MVIAHTNLKFLAAVLVLLRPLGVIFPGRCKHWPYCMGEDAVYFMISLSLTIRLISVTMSELTHTDKTFSE